MSDSCHVRTNLDTTSMARLAASIPTTFLAIVMVGMVSMKWNGLGVAHGFAVNNAANAAATTACKWCSSMEGNGGAKRRSVVGPRVARSTEGQCHRNVAIEVRKVAGTAAALAVVLGGQVRPPLRSPARRGCEAGLGFTFVKYMYP